MPAIDELRFFQYFPYSDRFISSRADCSLFGQTIQCNNFALMSIANWWMMNRVRRESGQIKKRTNSDNNNNIKINYLFMSVYLQCINVAHLIQIPYLYSTIKRTRKQLRTSHSKCQTLIPIKSREEKRREDRSV